MEKNNKGTVFYRKGTVILEHKETHEILILPGEVKVPVRTENKDWTINILCDPDIEWENTTDNGR